MWKWRTITYFFDRYYDLDEWHTMCGRVDRRPWYWEELYEGKWQEK